MGIRGRGRMGPVLARLASSLGVRPSNILGLLEREMLLVPKASVKSWRKMPIFGRKILLPTAKNFEILLSRCRDLPVKHYCKIIG